MTLKHNNPDEARLYQKKRRRTVVSEQEHWAHAPYNFVPLPKALIPAETPLDHDKYHVEDGVTGYLDITLETCSPTYIRGMMSEVTFKQSGRSKAEDTNDEDKEKRSPFFSSSDQTGVWVTNAPYGAFCYPQVKAKLTSSSRFGFLVRTVAGIFVVPEYLYDCWMSINIHCTREK